MKKIKVNSSTHGSHLILVDDEDFNYLKDIKWSIQKGGKNFYAVCTIKENSSKKVLKMHRIIKGLINDSKMLIDHINHNGLDNRKENLRICTIKENSQNKTSHKKSSSKFLGVSFHKRDKKWASRIRVENKLFHLGNFNNENDAAKAYNDAAKKHFGEFANLNIV